MSQRLAKRVMLIGWDAADWEFIDPLLDAGKMPHLARLIESGVRGNIATLSPILSPMLWNSIATGKLGDKHGILGFAEPDGKGGLRAVTATSRKCKAIWNVLSQQGLRSCVVNWFASHPPEPINGVVVSDRFRRTATHDDIRIPFNPACVHPPELAPIAEQLQVLPNELTPEQLLPFVPSLAEIREDGNDTRYVHLARYLAECASIHNITTYLAEHETWDLLAVYLDTIDHLGHGFMEFHPPKMEHTKQDIHDRYQHVMTATYLFHDMMLGRLVELAGPETAYVILSDHGFHSGKLRPRRWWDPQNPDRLIGPGTDPLAWHRQQGMLVVSGPGVKKDELVFGASLLDVMPTILAMLGLPIAGDLDGKPLVQIFQTRPALDEIASYEPDAPQDGMHRGPVAEDPFAAQESLQQLVDLGYMEPLSADAEANLRQNRLERDSVLAQIYYSSGRVEEARQLLEELTRDHKGTYLLNRLTMCLMDLGRVDEAEAVFSQIDPKDLDRPVLLTIRGQLKYARKEFDEAFELFRQAGEADDTQPIVHVYLGMIHIQGKRWELARQAYERALAIDPDSAAAHDGLAVALRELGDLDKAMFHHMRSVSLIHNQPEGHLHLAQTAVLIGQFDWAIRALQIATELAPEWPFPHRVLARLYRQVKNDPAKSEEHLRKSAELRLKHMRREVSRKPVPRPA